MKIRFTFLAVMFAIAAASQESRQVPRGIREADKAEAAFEKNIPPPQIVAQRKPPDLQKDADLLSALAASIPGDLESVHKGMLPKELILKLKRIEKLSKELRSGLNP